MIELVWIPVCHEQWTDNIIMITTMRTCYSIIYPQRWFIWYNFLPDFSFIVLSTPFLFKKIGPNYTKKSAVLQLTFFLRIRPFFLSFQTAYQKLGWHISYHVTLNVWPNCFKILALKETSFGLPVPKKRDCTLYFIRYEINIVVVD